ncbi:MAG: GNAT family N-acetyltransferase [Candidatus Dormibacteraeota bacterium]|uniref:GNAT family N-acetyltransferase n=1 Tax=Candidatus Amunia macphersoniae TaxID=3127014 RepID=A0A934NAI0_9BACT|nr:GNAT family N-acetyltransferase [Candidatus Dormibacteraeota bacterium]
MTLFDDPEIAYRLPVASLFDAAAARDFIERAQQARVAGRRLQLAITADGREPQGEVMLNLESGSVGYMVGRAYRRRGVAARALGLITRHAHGLGFDAVTVEAELDNLASIDVARRAGFQLTERAPAMVEDKGRRYALHAWVHRMDRP